MNAGCTVATCVGASVAPSRATYGSGARSTSWTTKPRAVPVRFSDAAVTDAFGREHDRGRAVDGEREDPTGEADASR